MLLWYGISEKPEFPFYFFGVVKAIKHYQTAIGIHIYYLNAKHKISNRICILCIHNKYQGFWNINGGLF